MDPAKRSRDDKILIAIMVGSASAAAIIVTVAGLAHALGVREMLGLEGHLSLVGTMLSIAAYPMAILVFWAARRLHHRALRTEMLVLRREDIRNRNHTSSVISLCRSLTLGTMGPGSDPAAVAPAMRHVADRIGTSMAMYGYLFTDAGRQATERVRNSALRMVSSRRCVLAELSGIAHDLEHLDGELLEIDDDVLVRRRMQEAGVADPE